MSACFACVKTGLWKDVQGGCEVPHLRVLCVVGCKWGALAPLTSLLLLPQGWLACALAHRLGMRLVQ